MRISAPRISPHAHTGRRLHRHHTSYAGLVMVVLLGGIGLALVTTQVEADSSNIAVSAQVFGSSPQTAPVITAPSSGQRFGRLPITVTGTCTALPGWVVKVFKNQLLAGSAVCQGSGFELKIDLVPGRNDLVARQYDAADQVSPDSPVVTVYYDPPSPAKPPLVPPSTAATPAPRPAPGLALEATSAYQRAGVNATISWPVTLIGGRGPYAISWDWGDGQVDLLSRAEGGSFSTTHSYRQAGNYAVAIKATDYSGQSAYLQLTAMVRGAAAPAATSQKSAQPDYGRLVVLWPLYILLLFVLVSFWLGERYEKWQIKQHWKRLPS